MSKKLPARPAVVVAVAALGLFAILMNINWATTKAARKVTVVYVGAENCGPCDSWQRKQAVEFRDSAEFRRLAYREVKSPNLFDVLKDNYWPEDLRVYRQTISQSAGVPLWLIIADNQLVTHASGLTQWQKTILPTIRSLL